MELRGGRTFPAIRFRSGAPVSFPATVVVIPTYNEASNIAFSLNLNSIPTSSRRLATGTFIAGSLPSHL